MLVNVGEKNGKSKKAPPDKKRKLKILRRAGCHFCLSRDKRSLENGDGGAEETEAEHSETQFWLVWLSCQSC